MVWFFLLFVSSLLFLCFCFELHFFRPRSVGMKITFPLKIEDDWSISIPLISSVNTNHFYTFLPRSSMNPFVGSHFTFVFSVFWSFYFRRSTDEKLKNKILNFLIHQEQHKNGWIPKALGPKSLAIRPRHGSAAKLLFNSLPDDGQFAFLV